MVCGHGTPFSLFLYPLYRLCNNTSSVLFSRNSQCLVFGSPWTFKKWQGNLIPSSLPPSRRCHLVIVVIIRESGRLEIVYWSDRTMKTVCVLVLWPTRPCVASACAHRKDGTGVHWLGSPRDPRKQPSGPLCSFEPSFRTPALYIVFSISDISALRESNFSMELWWKPGKWKEMWCCRPYFASSGIVYSFISFVQTWNGKKKLFS